MDVFTDVHSGFQFCINTEDPSSQHVIHNGINYYTLIKWCESFITSEGTFVDIGSNMGTFSIILSKKCKEVYSFEADKSTFDRLNIGLCLNNCFNINCNNVTISSQNSDQSVKPNIRTLDSYEITNINFMRIAVKDELEVIKGAHKTLVTNNFPPFILEVHNDEWYLNNKEYATDVLAYLKDLGYKIRPISGVDNVYLICDHDIKKEEIKDTLDEDKLDLGSLSKMATAYESNLLDDDKNITWDIWHTLANYYRKMPTSQALSYDCAMRGLKCSPPPDKEYLLYEEIAIVAFYVDKKAEGHEACDNVVLSPYAPWSVRNYTLNNQAFYMRRLPFKKIISMKYDLPTGQIESTSSLVKTENGMYRLNLMTVNYSIDKKGGYDIRDRMQLVKNKSFLLTLDPNNLAPTNGIELQDVSGVELYQQNIRGFENVRLFGDNEMLCTYRAINTNHIHQICYCCYDPITGHVTKVLPLSIGDEIKDEANWLPFINNNEAYFVYKISPLILYKLNRDTGEVTLVKEVTLTDKNLDSFLGSGGLIPYKNGWLATCHQVYHDSNPKDFHRLVWFNKDFTEMKYSHAFYFESPDIEYNLSICHSNEGLLVPYSQRDNNSKIGILNYEIIDSWLSL